MKKKTIKRIEITRIHRFKFCFFSHLLKQKMNNFYKKIKNLHKTNNFII